MKNVTLRQQAYASIKAMLVAGKFPAGTALSETQLAKDLGMSRTPIREAIRQMEMEGIVEYSPRFSVVVKTPSGKMVEEMFGVREALETHAAWEAARSISASELDELEQLCASMEAVATRFDESGEEYLPADELGEYNNADMAFHEAIVKASGNEYLSKLVTDTKLLVRVFTSAQWMYNLEKLREANDFHRRLLNALIDRNPDEARNATIEAMRVAKANAVEQFESMSELPESQAL